MDRKHKLTSGVMGSQIVCPYLVLPVVFPGAVRHCGMSSFFLCIYQVVVVGVFFLGCLLGFGWSWIVLWDRKLTQTA